LNKENRSQLVVHPLFSIIGQESFKLWVVGHSNLQTLYIKPKTYHFNRPGRRGGEKIERRGGGENRMKEKGGRQKEIDQFRHSEIPKVKPQMWLREV